MTLIRILAFQILFIPASASTCLPEIGCEASDSNPGVITTPTKTSQPSMPIQISHDHNDPQHRWQIIMESHEFASKTCSYDVNCDSGYRCDLQPGFHKGVCLRKR
ncbi:MAG: hypothetical protein ACI9W6_001685 [Motiliproteus sp.]|jgi:hypothetical protein